jgi:hypothetical protein
MTRTKIVLPLVSIILASASSFGATPLARGTTGPAAGPPLRDDAEPLTGILERIRQDVGYYEVEAARRRHDIDPDRRDDPEPDWTGKAVCPTAELDLDVTMVEARLQTVVTESASGGVGLRVPFFGKEGSADANMTRTDTQTETITLERRFHYDTAQLEQYETSTDFTTLESAHMAYVSHPTIDDDGAKTNPVLPIADTLMNLRSNMTAAAGKWPCFEWEDKLAKPGSITFDFLVQHAKTGDVGFNFWIVSARASANVDRTLTNTITVSFAPHPVPASATPAPSNASPTLSNASPAPGVSASNAPP